jgi:hypothetical protein
MAKRPPLVDLVCTKCSKPHRASIRRAHDMCIKCASKIYARQQQIERSQELEPWQIEMYLDAWERNETAMPWQKRKIR